MGRTDHLKIEELDQENKELKKENQLLKTIIDAIHESIFVVNEKDEIILYNSEAEKMEGLRRENILGKKEDEVYAQPYLFSEEVTKKVLKTGKPIIEQPYWYYLHDGRKINMIFSAFPFYYNGKISAVYVLFRNMNQIGDFIAATLEMQKKFIREESSQHNRAMYLLDDVIGISKKINQIVIEARRISSRTSPVLIVGETGTGKELFAQGIHNASLHSTGPFIPVNCAAIPDTLLESVLFGTVKGAFTGAADIPGLFEQAQNGTIFLDEINSMSFSLQAKLLRVLQDKTVRRLGSKDETPVNCRIISATNIDPLIAVRDQAIRSDLYYRLATVTISIPPLRERKEDIKILAMHFIKKYNVKFGLFIDDITPELFNLLEQYPWPGNVRELENLIEGAMNFVLNDDKTLNINHLPEYFRNRLISKKYYNYSIKGSLQNTLAEIEKNLIQNALSKNMGNITKTSQELGISRQNLHYKIKSLSIKI